MRDHFPQQHRTAKDLSKWLLRLLPLLPILLLVGLAIPRAGHAACSPYVNQAVINEVRSDVNYFLEIKLLNLNIDPSVFKDWTVTVDNIRQGTSTAVPLSSFTDNSPYFTTRAIDNKFLDLSTTGASSGTDIILRDAAGNTIDYLSVAGHTDQQDPSCNAFNYDTDFPGSNSFEAARLPDGTGDWVSLGEGNNFPPTEGFSNDGAGVLILDIGNATVAEGGVAEFFVTLSEPAPAGGITVDFQTIDDTAVAGADYLATSGTLAIPEGATFGVIQVETLTDVLDDDGEQFLVFISNPALPVGGTIANHYGLGTISSTLPAFDHFRIVHPATASTCQPAEITVIACQDALCSLVYDDPIDMVLSPTGWVGGEARTLTGGSDTFQLVHTTPGTVTLDIPASDPATSNVFCYEGGIRSSCTMLFQQSGFVFDVPNLTSCATSGSISLQAVGGQACTGQGSFANRTMTVSFWSTYLGPSSGDDPVLVNGTAVAGSSPGTPIALAFDASATATLNVRYHDAGQLQLDARYVGSGPTKNLVLTGTDSFVVSPFDLVLAASYPDGTPLDNATDSGAPLWPAGEDFTLEVTAQCQDGTVTDHFAWATDLVVSAFSPTGGTRGSLTYNTLAAGDFASGIATVTGQQYTEVGTTTLRATAASYLGAGDVVGAGTAVGRFTPHHFDVAFNSPSFATACPTGGFTYLGEFFEYAIPPILTVTAENGLNQTTRNYTDAFGGDWFKLTHASLGSPVYNAATGTLDTSRLPSPDPVITDFGDGTAALIFDAGSIAAGEGLGFQRGDFEPAFDAEISLAIDVVDGDGIAYAVNPARFGTAAAGGGIAFDFGKAQHWGRLILRNAFGPEILPLAVPLQAEVYNSAAVGFLPNAADSCTLLTEANLTLQSAIAGPQPGNLPIAVRGTRTTAASIANQPLVGGDAGLVLSAPGEGGDGWVDLSIDLSPGGLDRPWLRFDWDGDGLHDNDPASRAVFGIYKGHPNRIYLRETVRQ